ncbi:MAG: biotin--[acetyl-CoA-carboxylase] ligase [Candidatus Zixiibacteriota bacterium]
MIVYTDSLDYAQEILPSELSWRSVSIRSVNGEIEKLVACLFPTDMLAVSELSWNQNWKYLLLVKTAPQSQYDVLIKLARKDEPLPNGILCLASTGSKLHGFKNRPWVALPGNIHLSVFLTPRQKVDHFGVGFTILTAVSVVEAIDSIKGLEQKAALKWVNDILIGYAKVAGVIAHTQSQGEVVTGAVLGIGINVETTPSVERDPFVPRVASLRNFVPDPFECNQRLVFERLATCLDKNYKLLLSGQYNRLLDLYRERSVIIGREVCIYSDAAEGHAEELAQGTVVSIGENLELYLQDVDKPIFHGRLVLRR